MSIPAAGMSLGPRHRAPSWWRRWREGGEVATVAALLGRNRRLLFNDRLRQYQREHKGQRPTTVISSPVL